MSRTRNTANLVSQNALNASDGNIGVGTTARSTETLFVEGDSRITGILTATSFVSDDVTSTSLVLPEGLISSGVTTTTTTSESSLDSFSASSYRSAKYQIQITQGSSYNITEISLVHDGSDSYGTEYGTVRTGISLASFNIDIDGGNVRLLATPASSSSTTFKLVRKLIEL